ncbi:hypothetical protein [Luteimonas panaciterrae]|uniref:hypothetical protein n=1 Tax=Luteimonas panaciterrae TaxID=363885 RepID=UPI001CFB9458|nr:hypothetical protein [Luteimonas panaciterrae]
MPTNPMGPTYIPSRFIRYVLTDRNLKELDIVGREKYILGWENEDRRIAGTASFLGSNWLVSEFVKALAKKKDKDGYDRYVLPSGFSINDGRFGKYPKDERSAKERKWYAYMNKGQPLIEERSDIVQPRPEVISEQVYVNRTDPQDMRWESSVEFSIENEISWSLEGSVDLTFDDKASASFEQEIEVSKEVEAKAAARTTQIAHNHKDDVGSESQFEGEVEKSETNEVESTSTGTGEGEVSADLKLGIMGEVSGSITTGWKQTSTLSGTVGSRVVVRATQRRQIKRYNYTIPIVFDGYVALYYDEPVKIEGFSNPERMPGRIRSNDQRKRVQALDPSGNSSDEYAQIVVHNIQVLGLVRYGENYDLKGWAEVVSTLVGEHEAFEVESLSLAGRNGSVGGYEELLYKY